MGKFERAKFLFIFQTTSAVKRVGCAVTAESLRPLIRMFSKDRQSRYMCVSSAFGLKEDRTGLASVKTSSRY